LAAGGQHVGFIIIRATDVKSRRLPGTRLGQVVDLVSSAPWMRAHLRHRTRDPGGPALRLFDDLFVTGNGAAVDQIIEQTPNDARYFTGFVGWQAGELAKELEAGYWYVTDPDAALLFSDETGSMWNDLLKRVGSRSPGTNSI
jgi:hypothetical protein